MDRRLCVVWLGHAAGAWRQAPLVTKNVPATPAMLALHQPCGVTAQHHTPAGFSVLGSDMDAPFSRSSSNQGMAQHKTPHRGTTGATSHMTAGLRTWPTNAGLVVLPATAEGVLQRAQPSAQTLGSSRTVTRHTSYQLPAAVLESPPWRQTTHTLHDGALCPMCTPRTTGLSRLEAVLRGSVAPTSVLPHA
jgi:hypothetical protein